MRLAPVPSNIWSWLEWSNFAIRMLLEIPKFKGDPAAFITAANASPSEKSLGNTSVISVLSDSTLMVRKPSAITPTKPNSKAPRKAEFEWSGCCISMPVVCFLVMQNIRTNLFCYDKHLLYAVIRYLDQKSFTFLWLATQNRFWHYSFMLKTQHIQITSICCPIIIMGGCCCWSEVSGLNRTADRPFCFKNPTIFLRKSLKIWSFGSPDYKRGIQFENEIYNAAKNLWYCPA